VAMLEPGAVEFAVDDPAPRGGDKGPNAAGDEAGADGKQAEVERDKAEVQFAREHDLAVVVGVDGDLVVFDVAGAEPDVVAPA
jgi:hypothetical protein